MLKVLPVQSKTEQEKLCSICKIKYRPELLMYAASVEGVLVGVCQFITTDKGGVIYDIAVVEGCTVDEKAINEALFVMGRGALNFIDLCGVHTAFYKGNSPDDTLLHAIGFRKNEKGEYEMDLNGFFTDHCH